MGDALTNTLIAAGIVLAIGFGWITHIQNRGRRPRAATGGDGGGGDSYSGTSDGFSLGSWFSSGSSNDAASCSTSDSGSSSGDCGGGGDGGGGGD